MISPMTVQPTMKGDGERRLDRGARVAASVVFGCAAVLVGALVVSGETYRRSCNERASFLTVAVAMVLAFTSVAFGRGISERGASRVHLIIPAIAVIVATAALLLLPGSPHGCGL